MDPLSIDDLLLLIGQKEAMIAMLSRRITALMTENQALQARVETPTPQETA